MILRLKSILFHLLETFFSLIVLLLKAFIIALHFHFGIEVLLEGIKLYDVIDLNIPRGEVEHIIDRNVVGIHKRAAGQHLVIRFSVFLENLAQLPKLQLAVAIEQ